MVHGAGFVFFMFGASILAYFSCLFLAWGVLYCCIFCRPGRETPRKREDYDLEMLASAAYSISRIE